MAKNEIIRLENVSKIYQLGDVQIKALDEINLGICKGEFIAVLGPSGSGKTTLLDVLSTMLQPTSGKVIIEGNATNEMDNERLSQFRGEKIGMIFQSFNLLPKLTALENVMVPMWVNKLSKSQRRKKAVALLEKVGLGDRLYNRPNQLSGGQMQRVAIARSLALDPTIIVADEPTGNLDSKSEDQIIDILCELNTKEGKTILLVTHEPEIGRRAPKQILMRDGKIEKTIGFSKCNGEKMLARKMQNNCSSKSRANKITRAGRAVNRK
ncbi:MAG: ABC transporter ATP-binding protein [Candidatus Diapherotrites archaeon]|nr:ABC transporter ATP-binding protein [Candidatus Diapherotrites archaeon]